VNTFGTSLIEHIPNGAEHIPYGTAMILRRSSQESLKLYTTGGCSALDVKRSFTNRTVTTARMMPNTSSFTALRIVPSLCFPE